MAKILIIYSSYRKRETLHTLLYCYERYSHHRCYYLNIDFFGIPWYVKKIHWDLVIFHTLFFSLRYDREQFKTNMRNISFLREIDAVKIALPQDEYLSMDLVCDCINEFKIEKARFDHVWP